MEALDFLKNKIEEELEKKDKEVLENTKKMYLYALKMFKNKDTAIKFCKKSYRALSNEPETYDEFDETLERAIKEIEND